MNRFRCCVTLSTALFCLFPASALGTRALLARIDNPVLFNETATCSPQEMNTISNTIEGAIGKSRRLDGSRGLVPARCRGGCQRAPSFCHFVGIGCVATRRRLELKTSSAALRGLGDKVPKEDKGDKECSQDVEEINARLRSVVPAMSSQCQEMMHKHSRFSCEVIVPCTISHFSLWNTATNKVIAPIVSGKDTSFCASVAVTFEAIVNFDSGPLQFNLFNKKFSYTSKVVTNEPYFMTDGSPNNSSLVGLMLGPGTYELTGWPEHDTTKRTATTFVVKKC